MTLHMERNISWDDIPSLAGVEVDWDYKPQSTFDKRGFIRLDMGAIFQLVEVREIVIKLATSKQTFDGTLVDISVGGLALNLPVLLETNLPVKVGLILGSVKIISRATVRHAQKERGRYTTGLRFVDLAPESAEYIAGLYAAKVLCHAT